MKLTVLHESPDFTDERNMLFNGISEVFTMFCNF